MKKRVKGFTLTELIIVIAIMGVLLAILIPSWMYYIKNSRIKTQNSNAKVIYNAAQTVVQEYKFSERSIDPADRNVGSGSFVFYWDGTSATAKTGTFDDSDGDSVGDTINLTAPVTDDAFLNKFANDVNRLFSGDSTTNYKIYVENYLVRAVVSGRYNTDNYLGSYPVIQEEEQSEKGANKKSVEDFVLEDILLS